ncbi:MAG: hypothetical protein HY781_09890 [Chloroflexi bacterium]|nr:hypothetical protein [Chloroflexota bacterium]
MNGILFWLYLINLTLLILHEMDSAYWQEWKLFHIPGGIGGFLLIHLPLWVLALYGLVLLHDGMLAGLVLSLVLSFAGLFAFGIHTWFIHKGHPEFRLPVSRGVLWALLLISPAQAVFTILVWR